jgi:hypothetical protein
MACLRRMPIPRLLMRCCPPLIDWAGPDRYVTVLDRNAGQRKGSKNDDQARHSVASSV